MAFITIETYQDEQVNLNTDHIQGVTSYLHYDENLPLPLELTFINSNGQREQLHDDESVAKVHAIRTSERTLVSLTNGSSYEVKPTVAQVLDTIKKAK